MSLQIILGDTNSGKSHTLVSTMVERAWTSDNGKFFVIVPEQATLKMQKDVVRLHPAHAAMNIDVVSFDRLAHVIFSELGVNDGNVLDDIGKVLILRKVLKENQKDLTVYQNKVHLAGFADEVKSILTELNQYGIDDNQLFLMQESAQDKGNQLLFSKLADIRLLSRKFKDEIKDTYQVAEEVLDLFARVAERSAKLKDSHIYLDGFTGFTPIQYRLLTSMLKVAEDVTVSLTLPQEEIRSGAVESDLFYLSNQTYLRLRECAENAKTEILPDIAVTKEEKQKPPVYVYPAANTKEEVLFAAKEILRLVREEGYRFRDIAVVTGDVESYYVPVRELFEEAQISCFLDHKTHVTENQLARFLMGAVRLLEESFSRDAVFSFLKTGLTDLTMDEIGRLENYCLEFGIRGFRSYENPFTKNSNWDLDEINTIREKFLEGIREFYFGMAGKDKKAGDFQEQLQDLCRKYAVEEKIHEETKRLNEEGRLALAKEYDQIYKLLMELLQKIALLVGDAPISVKDYREVLENALKEVKIGIIPPSLDAVIFGDLTRTRLDKIRALILLGVNDGKIPKTSAATGLFTQRERELLRENFEIAPTVEEDLFTQRFYLYLMLNKPKEKLYLTYACATATGEELKPSYLLDDLDELIGADVSIETVTMPELFWKEEALRDLAGRLNRFAESGEDLAKDDEALFSYFAKADPAILRAVVEGAFFTNKQTALDPAVAEELYGEVLKGSVSRYENFNQCPYKHFLNYGLRIDERPEYQIEATDLGTLYHAALEKFGQKLKAENKSFRDISDADSERITNACVDEALAEMKSDVLSSSKRYEYLTERIRQVTQKTTQVLRDQVKAGLFEPEAFEYSFSESVGDHAKFTGKIDRIDLYDAGDILVKIIDYKSGKKDFKIEDVYSGLMLQLVGYMTAAIEKVKRENPDRNVLPGGIYYYRIKDSFEEEGKHPDEKFRMSGLTSSEEGVIQAMDQSLADANVRSTIIPVNSAKDKAYDRYSVVADATEFSELMGFVQKEIADVSDKIRGGCVDIAPFKKGSQENGCKYCQYKDVCRFEPGHFGTDWRDLLKTDDLAEGEGETDDTV